MAHVDCDCVVCSGSSYEAFYEDTKRKIKEFGQAIVGVGDDNVTEFFYTIGRHERGLPELLLIGNYDFGQGCMVLNVVNDLDKDGHPKILTIPDSRLPTGEEGKVKCVRLKASAKEEYTIQVQRYYQIDPSEYTVLQVLVGDLNNRFPGDPKCEMPWASVPVLAEILN